MNRSHVNRLVDLFPDDLGLMRQAKSGDTRAFIRLYDAYVERVYLYIYCQVLDDRAAEGLTFQTFFSAWKLLHGYEGIRSPFIVWIYSIAHTQINTYYRTHKSTPVSEQDFMISVKRSPGREVQETRKALHFLAEGERQALILRYVIGLPSKIVARLMKRREDDIRILQIHALQKLVKHIEEKEIKVDRQEYLRILAESHVKFLNKTSTVKDQLVRYPEYAPELEPLLRTVFSLTLVRDVTPLYTFTAYTRDALLHHVATHPLPLQKRVAPSMRMSFSIAALILALLVTGGTVHAQSALPGESFYPWKRASEDIWRALSPNPVAADIVLAERRLQEWVLVANDPLRRTGAKNDYLEALTRLQTTNETETLVLIIPALQSQQQTLTDAGLTAPGLNQYLSLAISLVPASVTPMASPTYAVPTATVMNILVVPTEVVPTIGIPTEIVPTTTNVPIEIIPTQTAIPTEIIPTATEVPTEIVPTVTEVPTEVTPIPTDIPTEVVPTPTESDAPPENLAP
ncbi:MAG: hypothetical protein U0V02_00800 [Anaerolineales bacterium]